MRGKYKDIDSEGETYFNLDRPPKHHRANVGGRRISGRPSTEHLQKPRAPIDILKLHGGRGETPPLQAVDSSGYESSSSIRHVSRTRHDILFRHVTAWIQKEKARRAGAKSRRREKEKVGNVSGSSAVSTAADVSMGENSAGEASRRPSDATSEGSLALEKLQEILERNITLAEKAMPGTSRASLRRPPSIRKLRRPSIAASSDTEFFDGESLVPSCDVVLDNTRTLSYTGGLIDDSTSRPSMPRSSSTKEKEAWRTFKYEIVRLAHTLRLKGWRRVPMELSDKINVERLNGALTNAVYEVSPPKDLPMRTSMAENGRVITHPGPRPPSVENNWTIKLLLMVT